MIHPAHHPVTTTLLILSVRLDNVVKLLSTCCQAGPVFSEAVLFCPGPIVFAQSRWTAGSIYDGANSTF